MATISFKTTPDNLSQIEPWTNIHWLVDGGNRRVRAQVAVSRGNNNTAHPEFEYFSAQK